MWLRLFSVSLLLLLLVCAIEKASRVLEHALTSRSGPFEWLRIRLVALRCFAVALLIAVSPASAQTPDTVGQFSPVMTWGCLSIHSCLLRLMEKSSVPGPARRPATLMLPVLVLGVQSRIATTERAIGDRQSCMTTAR